MVRLIPNPKKIKLSEGKCSHPDNIKFYSGDFENSEAYSIKITEKDICVRFSSSAGKFYSEKTLEQLCAFYPDGLPCLEIEDYPTFAHRGFMLDSARHFIPVDEIKKIADINSTLKFNRFHWHLSDDQGFRIELDTLRELTEKGSVRPGDSFRLLPKTTVPHSGYYTKEEIREVVDYCKERHIQIIPEIDMPGHVSAILHVYPQYHCGKVPVEIKTKEGIFPDIFCAGNPETYDFIYKLLDEVTELFPFEYFHIGGDEAPKTHWKKCPQCQSKMKELGIKTENDFQVYFGNTVARYLMSKNKKVIMWNDILKGNGLDKNVTVQRWMDIKNVTLPETNSGRDTVISDFKPYYADYPYEMFPLKSVYSFDPLGSKGLNQVGKKSILGIESPVWLEFIDTAEKLEYMIYPRWFAVADTAWCHNQKGNYSEFKKSCVTLCNSFYGDKINYAPAHSLDPSLFKRLCGTLKFFKKDKGGTKK